MALVCNQEVTGSIPVRSILEVTDGHVASECVRDEPPEQTVLSIKQAATQAIAIARTRIDTGLERIHAPG